MLNLKELERLMLKFGDYPMVLANDNYFHPLNEVSAHIKLFEPSSLEQIDFADKDLSLGVIDENSGDESFFTSEIRYQYPYWDDPSGRDYQIYWFQIVD